MITRLAVPSSIIVSGPIDESKHNGVSRSSSLFSKNFLLKLVRVAA